MASVLASHLSSTAKKKRKFSKGNDSDDLDDDSIATAANALRILFTTVDRHHGDGHNQLEAHYQRQVLNQGTLAVYSTCWGGGSNHGLELQFLAMCKQLDVYRYTLEKADLSLDEICDNTLAQMLGIPIFDRLFELQKAEREILLSSGTTSSVGAALALTSGSGRFLDMTADDFRLFNKLAKLFKASDSKSSNLQKSTSNGDSERSLFPFSNSESEGGANANSGVLDQKQDRSKWSDKPGTSAYVNSRVAKGPKRTAYWVAYRDARNANPKRPIPQINAAGDVC